MYRTNTNKVDENKCIGLYKRCDSFVLFDRSSGKTWVLLKNTSNVRSIFVFTFASICRVHPNFFVILFQRSQVFSGFVEFAVVHTFLNVPVRSFLFFFVIRFTFNIATGVFRISQKNIDLTGLPVDESALPVHQVELPIQPGPRFCYCCCVCKHRHSSLHFSEVTTWYYSGWLIVDTDLKV